MLRKFVLLAGLATILTGVAAPAAAAADYKIALVRVTYADDDDAGLSHLFSVAELAAASGEIEQYFRLLSNGELDLDVTAAEAPDLGDRGSYADSPALMDAVFDSAEAAGHRDQVADADAIAVVHAGRSPGTGCDFYIWRHQIANVVGKRVGLIFAQEGCGSRVAIGPGPSPAPMSWGGLAHEIGHFLQDVNHRQVIHPAGYADGYNLLDSCYPCGSGLFDLTGGTVVGGNLSAFPGSLPASKVVTAPRLGSTSVELAPLSERPAATGLPQGVKIPIDDISVPVSATQRWTSAHYYLVEYRRRVNADSYGRPVSPVLAMEGVQIHQVAESRHPPVRVAKPCDAKPPAERCEGLPGSTVVYDPYCLANPAPRDPACWPYSLWGSGQVFRGLGGVDVSIGRQTQSSVPVTVSRRNTKGANPFVIPWRTPPMHTYETVDLWIDSACNGYEQRGRVKGRDPFYTGGRAALRYGRRSAPTRAGRTVIGNGDDPCVGHENRL